MVMISVRRVTEPDFDNIVTAAGGVRYSSLERFEGRTADYRFDSSLAELKLAEAEGIDEPARQLKLARLFRPTADGRPVVVINPGVLKEEERRAYRDTMGSTIMSAVKKAGKQLEATRTREGSDRSRVLIAINNGYGSFSHDEFKDAVVKFATHNTSKIDSVVVAGIYNHADDWENFFLYPFDLVPITLNQPFQEFDALRNAWNAAVEVVMTALVRGEMEDGLLRTPLRDLSFEADGTTYVKPAPRLGKPSPIWPEGRLRQNSTGIEECPPVARIFPILESHDWELLKAATPNSRFLRATYQEWCEHREDELAKQAPDHEPLVPLSVKAEAFLAWCSGNGLAPQERLLLEQYAPHVFSGQVRELVASARPFSASVVLPVRYVLVTTVEVGQDMMFDCSRIEVVKERLEERRSIRELVPWRRMFHEHALALGAAHALKLGIEVVLHHRDRTLVWE